MPKLTKSEFEAIKAAVRAVTPLSWAYTLRQSSNGLVTMKITEAPMNLPAIDAALNGCENRGYAKVSPLPYENDTDLPVIGIWRALQGNQLAQFDADGERTGSWHAVELWFGDWRAPFRLVAVQ